jgi:hypothetical protein
MVQCHGFTPNQYNNNEPHHFCDFWLNQRHPYGYMIDYFNTLEDAQKAIEKEKQVRPDTEKYWYTFTIYKLTDCASHSDVVDAGTVLDELLKWREKTRQKYILQGKALRFNWTRESEGNILWYVETKHIEELRNKQGKE